MVNGLRRIRPRAWYPASLLLGLVLLSASPAAAQDDATAIANLAEKALRLYDDLDFQRAAAVLQQALKAAEAGDIADTPIAARVHLYLGMIELAGLQHREAAEKEFRLARRIDPSITPPEGLFNPEVAALFAAITTEPSSPGPGKAGATTGEDVGADAGDDARKTTRDRAGADAAVDVAGGEEGENGATDSPLPPRRTKDQPPVHSKKKADTEARADEVVDDEADDDENPDEERPFLVALSLGAGGGTAAGHIDMKGITPNTAPGRFAISELAHATIAAGYFMSPAVLIALEARLQLVTGATPHCDGTTCGDTSGFAAAALVKLSYFLGEESLRWFGTVGVGGGTIRQVVKLTGLPDCGRTGNQQCFDTVTGGPFLMAAGGGIAYQFDSLVVLGGVTANLGVPNVMLNVDLTLGAGLRF